MLTCKKYLLLLLSLTILLNGCAASNAPKNWLPDTEDIPKYSYGGWITVVKANTQKSEKLLQYSGEFIGADEKNVFILYDSLYILPKDKIQKSTLELVSKSTGYYAGCLGMGLLSTISNGLFMVITFPLWLLFGFPVVIGESYRDRYEEENPDEVYWNSIIIYSRFPQGMSGIDRAEIYPLFDQDKK